MSSNTHSSIIHSITECPFSTKANFGKWRFSIASQISGFNSTGLFLMGFLKNKKSSDVSGCHEKYLKTAESCLANRGHHLADIIFQS
ncbi:hypothetical protein GWI33_012102 [Rhynchophorus ferrugineus]|uniref:Uncharacterized protein n=1 Tax=Rhynchophorus ferrugineus TaxID=354439 RepID=A0A834M7W3_RHYFE|nr:hypothetical protein GWI33_012102 [Rhynchophorus ferrugineus]